MIPVYATGSRQLAGSFDCAHARPTLTQTLPPGITLQIEDVINLPI